MTSFLFAIWALVATLIIIYFTLAYFRTENKVERLEEQVEALKVKLNYVEKMASNDEPIELRPGRAFPRLSYRV